MLQSQQFSLAPIQKLNQMVNQVQVTVPSPAHVLRLPWRYLMRNIRKKRAT